MYSSTPKDFLFSDFTVKFTLITDAKLSTDMLVSRHAMSSTANSTEAGNDNASSAGAPKTCVYVYK